jgi:hypothetical protein
LRQAARDDASLGNELRRAELELAVQEAWLVVAQDDLNERRCWRWLDDSMRRPVVNRGQGPTPRSLNELAGQRDIARALIEFLQTRADASGYQQVAASEVERAAWNLKNITALRELEHASWQEWASAERDLAVARASQLSMQEAHRVAQLELERMQRALQRAAMDGGPPGPSISGPKG